MPPIRIIATLLLLGTAIPTAQAAPTTDRGQISVAQVFEMISRAPSDAVARNTLNAYLAGVGEATGVLVSQAQQIGAAPVHCGQSFNLDQQLAVDALSAAVPDQDKWAQTPATPIIIADMFSRAGCR